MTAAKAPSIPPALSEDEARVLLRAFNDLRSLADHDVPAIRGGVRAALAEVAQTLNRADVRYELYSAGLRP
jgi:Family of unknown function (DUF6052)